MALSAAAQKRLEEDCDQGSALLNETAGALDFLECLGAGETRG